MAEPLTVHVNDAKEPQENPWIKLNLKHASERGFDYLINNTIRPKKKDVLRSKSMLVQQMRQIEDTSSNLLYTDLFTDDDKQETYRWTSPRNQSYIISGPVPNTYVTKVHQVIAILRIQGGTDTKYSNLMMVRQEPTNQERYWVVQPIPSQTGPFVSFRDASDWFLFSDEHFILQTMHVLCLEKAHGLCNEWEKTSSVFVAQSHKSRISILTRFWPLVETKTAPSSSKDEQEDALMVYKRRLEQRASPISPWWQCRMNLFLWQWRIWKLETIVHMFSEDDVSRTESLSFLNRYKKASAHFHMTDYGSLCKENNQSPQTGYPLQMFQRVMVKTGSFKIKHPNGDCALWMPGTVVEKDGDLALDCYYHCEPPRTKDGQDLDVSSGDTVIRHVVLDRYYHRQVRQADALTSLLEATPFCPLSVRPMTHKEEYEDHLLPANEPARPRAHNSLDDFFPGDIVGVMKDGTSLDDCALFLSCSSDPRFPVLYSRKHQDYVTYYPVTQLVMLPNKEAGGKALCAEEYMLKTLAPQKILQHFEQQLLEMGA